MSQVMTAVESSRLEDLKRRVQRDPASIAFAALAEEYRRLGRFEEAIETCRAGLLRHPSYLSARVTLGRALVETGAYDLASTELERVLRTAPENLAAIRALADIHRRRGELPEGIESYVTAEEPPAFAPAASQPIPVAVQSPSVRIHQETPAIAGLEFFLAGIQRVRRDLSVHVR
jgi:tetratricopeptide (TPR) repeat protein